MLEIYGNVISSGERNESCGGRFECAYATGRQPAHDVTETAVQFAADVWDAVFRFCKQFGTQLILRILFIFDIIESPLLRYLKDAYVSEVSVDNDYVDCMASCPRMHLLT